MSHDCGSDGHDFGEIGHAHEGSHDGGLGTDAGRNNTGVFSTHKSTEVHIVSHGALNLKTEFVKIAQAMGMVPIDQYRQNLVAEDRVEKKILDWKAFTPPDDEPLMPSGHYPGATGWTRLWREWWQIGARSAWWKFWETPQPRFSQRTYLEIACTTWCYKETGDLETHLVITVNSLPVWDNVGGVWIYDGEQFDRHKLYADRLAARICQILQSCPPIPQAQLIRERLRNSTKSTATAPSPTSGDGDHPPIPSMPRPKSPPSLDTGAQTAGDGSFDPRQDADDTGAYH